MSATAGDDNRASSADPEDDNPSSELADALERGKIDKDGPLERFRRAARFVVRHSNPFVHFTPVLEQGLREDGLCEADEEEEDEEDEELDEAARERIQRCKDENRAAWAILKKRVWSFSTDMAQMGGRWELILELGRLVNDEMGRELVQTLPAPTVPENWPENAPPPPRVLSPPIQPKANKSLTRGFLHDQMARYLCPAKYLHQFESDPDFRSKLDNGTISISGEEFLVFYYPHGEFKPDDLDHMLLRSPFIIAFCRHIFTGPTSAVNDDDNGTLSGKALSKRCHAENDGMKEVGVTPENIAYTVVQCVHFLSASNNWNEVYSNLDKQIIFRTILDIFTNAGKDSRWYKDTIAWYNQQLFGTAGAATVNRAESDLAHLRRQRQEQQSLSPPRSRPATPAPPPPRSRLPTPAPPPPRSRPPTSIQPKNLFFTVITAF
ncbi:hypothetical protein CC2G_013236 [Coprinopsis cinerea AmutBmut pab1-1]|nr:hypothetical protein CC2G_013236 [Coprinopsis cinerea AmutBmut pab1-1]